jgi:hypothetical protein
MSNERESVEKTEEGSSTTSSPSAPLAIEAAKGDDGVQRLDVGGGSVALDHLGPLVVNSDGVSTLVHVYTLLLLLLSLPHSFVNGNCN